ncbi:hypothetical protein CN634_26375 [Bacillus pseudomycoides]|nr:hypothetical protein CN634_26375 [Bacillus pseudomycoides]
MFLQIFANGLLDKENLIKKGIKYSPRRGHHQAKKSEYPKTKKLTSLGENVHFFVLGCYKILKLMGMYGDPY